MNGFWRIRPHGKQSGDIAGYHFRFRNMTSPSYQPRLSVLIPTRNRKDQLRRVIDDVLRDKREYPGLEVVVVDGGSSDGTPDLLQQYGDQIVWKNQESRGLYAALNEALSLSTGAWVRMMADDDVYVTGGLPDLLAEMGRHPECLGVGGTSSFVSWNPEDVRKRGLTGKYVGEMNQSNCHAFQTYWLFSHEAMFFRREPLVAIGGWDPRFLVCGDVDLQFRLLRTGGSFFVIPREVLVAQRQRESATVVHARRASPELAFVLIHTRQWRLLVRYIWGMVRGLMK